MSNYQHKDKYYYKAKAQGLPSRASFKIEEILKKYPLLKKGDTVLDLGAAPGGWTVILAKTVGAQGRVLAIDLQKLMIGLPPHVNFLQADFESDQAQAWLAEQLHKQKLSAVFSDLSPKLTGITFKDAYLSYELGSKALAIAKHYLKPGGSFITKMFPGEEFESFLKKIRSCFKKVKVFEPQATRKTSKEVYLIGIGFHMT